LRLKKSLFINLCLGLCVSLLLSLLWQEGLIKRLEFLGLDTFFRLKKNPSFNPQIVIVEITDKDIVKIGRWPWKRSWHAAMTDALSNLGAKYIYFDILFSEAAEEKEDLALETALKESKNVYLPFVFEDLSFNIKKAFLPLERFSRYIKGTGTFNIYPDEDGVIRRMQIIFKDKDTIYPHMALKIAMDYLDLKIKKFTKHYLILSNKNQEIKIPLVEENKMLLNWYGKWKDTFKHYSFLEVLSAYQDLKEGKTPKINISDFKNSICLVAVTAIGLYDIKPIPLEPEYPGIGIFATGLSNILEKDFLSPVSERINILFLFLLALLPVILIFGEKPLRETLAVFLLGSAYFAISFSLFKKGYWLNYPLALAGLILSFLVVEIYNFVRVAMERQSFFKLSITDSLTGLFNIGYFKMLLETEILMARNDPSKKFSLLMLDIDHFKHFNDTYGHQIGDLVLKEVANILKSQVRSSDIVARYGGEEMIILLRGTSLKDATFVAEKIRKAVENHLIKEENQVYKVTISLGVSSFKPTDNTELIIKRADEALYQAKNNGRNRVEILD